MRSRNPLTIDLPLPEERIFRYASMETVLEHLVDTPTEEFTRQKLAARTEYDESSIYRAVELLSNAGLVTVSDERPARVSLAGNQTVGDEPLFRVPQADFRAPLRAYLSELRNRIDDHDRIDTLIGVILFGSVARGEADRLSDIDLLIVVDGDRTPSRRVGTAIAAEMKERRFDGDRYEFDVLVETVESARRAGTKLREIFAEGIVLHRTEDLSRIRTFVYEDEAATTDGTRDR